MVYDVVVVGMGGIGSAAIERLASRGASVVGVDRFPPTHSRGSSHGGSRVFRRAYFEGASYVELLEHASRGWDRLRTLTGRRLLHRCGVLVAGYPGTTTVESSRRSAVKHGIEIQTFDRDGLHDRWPMLDLPVGSTGLLEKDAGFVVPESGIQAHLEVAQRHGALFRWPFSVRSIDATETHLAIHSDRETIRARRAVVTAGAWSDRLIAQCGCRLDLVPHRKVIVWARPRRERRDRMSATRHPCWLVDDGGEAGPGLLYGVPSWPGQRGFDGMKFGIHGPGSPVDPDQFDRTVGAGEIESFESAIERRFPGVFETPHAATTCLYTMSRDEHFVLDRLPGLDSISIATGLSGHGYKFAPVLGEALADLTMDGGSNLPIDFLSIERFAG